MTGIERLRELIEENGPDRYIVVPAVGGTYQSGYIAATMDICNNLRSIADQIEREMSPKTDTSPATDAQNPSWHDPADAADVTSDTSKLTRDPAEDVSMSAYDLLPQEDRDAIAWVREHGGIAYVKDTWNIRRNLDRQLEKAHAKVKRQQRHIMFVQTKCRERQARIVELGKMVEFLKFNNSNFRALQADVAERLGFTRYGDDYEPEDLLDALDRRLMPEGMEWPRFEDEEPVRLGSEFGYGTKLDACEVTSILFTSEGCFIEPDYSWEGDDYVLMVKQGKRVKRPAPKVLDADGAEIDVGDDLFSVEGSLKFHVSHVDHINGKIATDAMFALDKWADPAMYTHRAPVLAADGKPLRVGETVWHKQTGKAATVKGFDRMLGEPCAVIDFAGIEQRVRGNLLTNERPDSWERLEEDAGKNPFDYCKDVGHRLDTCENSEAYKARDIVRRARALAERDA